MPSLRAAIQYEFDQKTGLLPANHIWHLENDQSLMLAEWLGTLEERALNESAVKMAEHAVNQEFDQLTPEDVRAKIATAVSKTAVKFGEFRTMHLSQEVISAMEYKNLHRGENTKMWSWAHLTETGYRGGFFKYVPGTTPVMKADDVLDYLSLLYCLMVHDAE